MNKGKSAIGLLFRKFYEGASALTTKKNWDTCAISPFLFKHVIYLY